MDYEKAYKEALERARKLWSEAKANEYTSDIEDYETIFPELAESEDEKIRKEMIEHFKSKTKETWCNIPVKDIIAYLEKQKEQKYIGLSKTDKLFLQDVADVLGDNEYKDAAKRLRDLSESLYLQPQQEWSKEDEKMRKAVLDEIEHQVEIMPDADDMDSDDQDRYNELISMSVWMEDLSKCREFHWKPSEEQMEALNALNCHGGLSYVGQQNQLISLYNDLKKLM